jgi:uncharacterized membrane protein YbhN (UPF0104 family)
MMKEIFAQVKPYLRWFILGGVLFFLIKTVKDRFAEVAAIRIDIYGWLILAIAVVVTIIAHVWSGWVWTWILAIFKQPLGVAEGIRVYPVSYTHLTLPTNGW